MREIKFRGLDKQGEWRYGFLNYNATKTCFEIHEVGDMPPTQSEPQHGSSNQKNILCFRPCLFYNVECLIHKSLCRSYMSLTHGVSLRAVKMATDEPTNQHPIDSNLSFNSYDHKNEKYMIHLPLMILTPLTMTRTGKQTTIQTILKWLAIFLKRLI